MKNLFLIICVIPFCGIAKAQHLSPSVIGSAGASFSNSTANTDLTLGEVATATYSSNIILTQGFHQGTIEVASAVIEIEEVVRVYPNPTTSLLNIELEKDGNLEVVLIDISGKIVLQDKMQNEHTKQLDLSHIRQGNYFLQIIKDNKKSVYQINKTK
ncbi:MAG: T9SS type A sorting domain-containing protein [Flavobacteriales bacterium]|nr:T9SS type A sorting domain-containing protein [Flavobacteriales bacterium]